MVDQRRRGGLFLDTTSWTDLDGVATTAFIPAPRRGAQHQVVATYRGDAGETVIGTSDPITTQWAPFVTTWQVQADWDNIVIPTLGSGYHYFVSWVHEDGTVAGAAGPLTGKKEITLPKAGKYEVRISGQFPQIDLGHSDLTNKRKLRSIEQWGDIEWLSMSGAFQLADQMVYNATDEPDLSNVTNLNYMFSQASLFNGDLRYWDVSHVTSMEGTFQMAKAFEGKGLSNWDVSRVTDMDLMFQGASEFNEDISEWNVKNVTSMVSMFSHARAFNHDLGGWDIRNVRDMSHMFDNSGMSRENYDRTLLGWASRGEQAPGLQRGVTVGALGLKFCSGAGARQYLIDEYNWNFVGDEFVDECEPAGLAVTVDEAAPWGGQPVTVTAQLTGPDGRPVPLAGRVVQWSATGGHLLATSSTTDERGQARVTFVPDVQAGVDYVVTAQYGELTANSPPIRTSKRPFVTKWQVQEDGDIIVIPVGPGGGARYFVSWVHEDRTVVGAAGPLTTSTVITLDKAGTYEVRISGHFPWFYFGSYDHYLPNHRHKLLSIEQWGDIAWASMYYAFYAAVNLQYNAVDVPDLSNVTDLTSMFERAIRFDGNLKSWDVSRVTRMRDMFRGAEAFRGEGLSEWEVGRVTDMTGMFAGAASFDQDLGNWDIRNVESMAGMFDGSGLSVENYDKTLMGWVARGQETSGLRNGVELGARGLRYCTGLGARDYLENEYGWQLRGDAIVPECVPEGLEVRVLEKEELWGGAPVPVSAQVVKGDGSPLASPLLTIRWESTGGGHFTELVTMTDETGTARNTFVPAPAKGARHEVTARYRESATGTSETIETEYGAFVTVWRSDAPGDTARIPTAGVGYEYVVSWVRLDDPAVQVAKVTGPVTGDAVVEFEDAGRYEIRITGSFPRIHFNNDGDVLRILSIRQWGDIKWTSMANAFYGAANLEYEATDVPDLSNVTDMSGMFRDAAKFNGNLDGWDVSKVANMRDMFRGATSFQGHGLSRWQVGNVTDMSGMFAAAEAFNENIGSWDVSKVTDMSETFAGAVRFNQNIGGWNVSNVTDMSQMFLNALMFNQPIGKWDVSRVTDMTEMLKLTPWFDQDLSGWDIRNVRSMEGMLDNSNLSFEHYDKLLLAWEALGKQEPGLQRGVRLGAADMGYCGAMWARQYLIDEYGWEIENDTFMPTCAPATLLVSVDNANPWGGQPVTVKAQAADQLGRPLPLPDKQVQWAANRGHVVQAATLTDSEGVAEVTFVPLPGRAESHTVTARSGSAGGQSPEIRTAYAAFVTTWATSTGGETIRIPTTGDGYHYYVSWVEEAAGTGAGGTPVVGAAGPFTGDAVIALAKAGTYEVRISGQFPRIYFNNNEDRLKIRSIEQWGDIAWSSMAYAFYGAANLVYKATDNPNLSNVRDLTGMWREAVLFDGDLSGWNVSNAESTAEMFYGAAAFRGHGLAGWNVSRVTNMAGMFQQATSFDQNLGSWDVRNVTAMENLFSGSGMSQMNYDQTIIGWAQRGNLQPNVQVGAAGLKYCESADARRTLNDAFGWEFHGDVHECMLATIIVTPQTLTPSAGDAVEVRAQLAAWLGTPVAAAGRQVRWAVTNGGQLSDSTTISDSDGVAKVTLVVSEVAGTQHVVTAQDALDPKIAGQTELIRTQAGPPSAIVLTVPPEAVAGAEFRVQATFADRFNNPVQQAGIPVTWTVIQDGEVVRTETGTTDEEGAAWLTLALSTRAGTEYTIKAVSPRPEGDLRESLSFTVGPAAPAQYRVTLADTPAAGRTVTVLAQLQDRYGNDVPQQVLVFWTVTRDGRPDPTDSIQTDENGTATLAIRLSTQAGTVYTVEARTHAGGSGEPHQGDTAETDIVGRLTFATQPGPAAAYTMTVTGVPQAGSRLTVSAQLVDVYGNRVREPGRAVTWIVTRDGVTVVESDATDEEGTATLALELSTQAGTTYRVEARSAGADGQDDVVGHVTVTTVPAEPYKYLVQPSSLEEIVGTSVTVTAQLADRYDNPIPQAGRTVAWSANHGILGRPTSTTNGDGIATVTLTLDTVAGTGHVVTATDTQDDTIRGQSDVITSRSGPPAQYVLTFSDPTPDPEEAVTVTAQLADAYGNSLPEAGRTVRWTVTGDAELSAASTLTDEMGQSVVTLRVAPVVGIVHEVRATDASDPGIQGSGSVRTRGTPAQYLLRVSGVPAAGSQVTVEAQLADGHGHPVAEAGHLVQWQVRPDGSLSAPSTVTDAQGVARVLLTVSTVAGTEHVVTATLRDDEDITGQITITTTAGPAAAYEVRVSDEAPPVGSSVSVEAQLVDEYGNAVKAAGRTVEWSVTNGGQLGATSTTTDAQGVARVMLTVSTVAGTEHVVTATEGENGTIRGESRVVRTQAGAAAQYVVSFSDPTPEAEEVIEVWAQLADAYGNPVAEAGREVRWTTNVGNLSASTSVTDGTGRARVALRTVAVVGVRHEVRATDASDPGIQGSGSVRTRGEPAQYLLRVSGVPAAGSQVTVEAQLADGYGQPIAEAGHVVQWQVTDRGRLSEIATVTDAQGLARVLLTVSTVAGTGHRVIATEAGNPSITGEIVITTVAGPGAAYEVKVSSLAPAAGTEVTVTAQLIDKYGNPVPEAGRRVLWSATNGGSFSTPASITDADGVATVVFVVSALAGAEHVMTATDADFPSVTGTSEPIRIHRGIDVGESGTRLFAIDRAQVADGGSAAELAVQLKGEGDGALVELTLPGVPVRFATSFGALSTEEPVLTDAQGVARIGLVSAEPGEAAVTAEVYIQGVGWLPVRSGSPATVTFVAATDALQVTQTVQPTYVRFNEPVQFTITITNQGPTALDGVTVQALLPAELVPDQSSFFGPAPQANTERLPAAAVHAVDVTSQELSAQGASVEYDPAAHIITWHLGSMAAGQSVVVGYAGSVEGAPEGTELRTAVVAGASGVLGYAYSNATIYVGTWPRMSLALRASTDTVAVGGLVRYIAHITNRADVAHPADSFKTQLLVRLPQGFRYVPGSTHIDGAPADDPAVDGESLVWLLGDVPPGKTIRLEYVAVAATAAQGDKATSLARVAGYSRAGFPYETDPKVVIVTVERGRFGIDGMILGSVFVDVNGNGRRDPGEPGVAGARLVTDEGLEVTAGEHGLFTIRNLYPGEHAVKLVGVPGVARDPHMAPTIGAGTTKSVRVPPSGIALLDVPVTPAAAARESGEGAPADGDGMEAHRHRGEIGAAAGSDSLVVGVLDMSLGVDHDGRLQPQIQGAVFLRRTLGLGLLLGAGDSSGTGGAAGSGSPSDGHGAAVSGTTLTLRYTTRPPAVDIGGPEAAFGDWVVTGDDSKTRDLAPSQSALYLRLDSSVGSLLYGDFMPPINTRLMPGRGRSTGWLAHVRLHSADTWRLSAYRIAGQWVEHYDELPLEGVSGPYHVKHTPVITGSETVWLLQVREDEALEAGRRLLVSGVDYTFDARTGTLWLARPWPSRNSDGTRNVLGVHYRTAGAGGSGSRGVRLVAGDEQAWPLAVSWQAAGDGTISTVGVDGTIRITETASVQYELAAQTSSTGSGWASHVTLGWNPTPLMEVKAMVQQVEGTFRRTPIGTDDASATSGTLTPGVEARLQLDYRLREDLRLAYERGLRAPTGDPAQHTDRLALRLQQGPLQHQIELQSSGESLLPEGTRSTALRLGSEWAISDRHWLAATVRLNLSNDDGARLVLPETLAYSLALSAEARLEMAFEAAEDSSSTPHWVVSLGTHRLDRPNVYGRYRIASGAVGRNELVVGLRHAWQMTPRLRLAVQAEQTAPENGGGRTALSWSAGYTAGGHDLRLRHELTSGSGQRTHTVTAAASGELAAGWSYGLSGRWVLAAGGGPATTSGETPVQELTASAAYRDREASRTAVVMQVADRLYRRTGAEGDEVRRTRLVAVDAAHRLNSGITLSGKVAYRRVVQEWATTGAPVVGSADAMLYQLSATLPVAPRWEVELFGRAISDPAGATLYGGALELRYNLTVALSVGLGYSSLDTRDPDLQLVAPWTKGIYLRVIQAF